MPANTHTWHAPTDHEHGDAPPAWADAFSCASFGHPVIFGGDESTPGEVAGHHDQMVHVAFKGIRFTKEGTDNWLRVHLHETPHGRCSVWHSVEHYTLDTSGNVTFQQGWVAFGEVAQGGGQMAGGDLAAGGTTHFITGADSSGQGEMWYAGHKYDAPWRWDYVIVIYDPLTHYNAGECADPMNIQTWELTGDFGLQRNLVHAMYYGSDSIRYPFRDTPRGWFCADVYGQITSTGMSGPGQCTGGSLDQYVASTMVPLETVAPAPRTYTCPSCGTLN